MALYASKEAVMSAISTLGFKVFRNGFFHWNSQRTPDTSVNNNGTIHRWTDGWHGDFIDFVKEVKGLSFGEAKKVAESLLGSNIATFEAYQPEINSKDKKPISEDILAKFILARKIHFADYQRELKLLFSGKVEGKTLPAAKWKNVIKISKYFQIGYIESSQRLIMPIRNREGIVTFWKYKKKGSPKVLFSKGRGRYPFPLWKLPKYNTAPIVLTEGEKDALVALANGIQAIAIGGAGQKIPEKYLHLFKGRKIILAGDYDEAGQSYNNRLASQLKDVANKVTILDWEAKAYLCGFKLHKGFDLSDYFAWKLSQ